MNHFGKNGEKWMDLGQTNYQNDHFESPAK